MKESIPDIRLLLRSNTQIMDAINAFYEHTPGELVYNHWNPLFDGAKIFKKDLENLESQYEEYMLIPNTKSKDHIDLYGDVAIPYNKGFYDGYFNFDKKYFISNTDPYTLINVGILHNVVCDKANMEPLSMKAWNRIFSNSTNIIMYENGVSRGQLYRAWILILSNPESFKIIFNPNNTTDKSKRVIKEFPTYLISDTREKLANWIKKTSADLNKGKEIAFLIHCLKEEGCLNPEKDDYYKTDLYKAMAKFIGKPIGRDSALNRFLGLNFINKRINVTEMKYKIINEKLRDFLKPQ